MVGRSISECVSHREDWNPLVDEKAVLRIIFNSLWPSELDFLIFTQGKLFSCFAFFENDLCGAGYKNSETQPGIPAPCRALRFHPQEWLVALNLNASIIIIHQARFGVKIPLPLAVEWGPESLWKICTIPAPLDWKAITDNVSWPFQFLRIL